MKKSVLSQSKARELFNYDPETGIVTYRKDNSRSKAGWVCGCINSNGYLAAYILKESWTLHRMIWLYVHGYLPKQLDHIDGDRTNNRLVNLREATPRLNSQNKHAARADSKTGYIGVSKRPNYPRWRARIVIGEKRVALGDFDSPQEARDAYLAAKRRHHEGCTI